MNEPAISVVVPTYRRPDRVRRLVAALEGQTLDCDRFEVVIVDDASGDDTMAVLADLAAATPLDLRPLGLEQNGGPAKARNLGWRSSRGAYVAFTDDDCVPRPDWLERLLTRAVAAPGLGVLQGATHRPAVAYPFTFNTVWRETLQPSPYFEGCNLTFSRAMLERTGGFDERYHLGCEDTSAGWAAVAQGGSWVFEAGAIVEHDIEERPLRYHLTMAWREGVFVDIAKRYPEFRHRGLWKPWAHRPWNLAFVVGFVATTTAVRWPVALLGWVPWLLLRSPSPRHPRVAARAVARRFLNDAVVEAGMLTGSIRNRIVVL